MRATGLAFASMGKAERFVCIVGLITGIHLMTAYAAQAQTGSPQQPVSEMSEDGQVNLDCSLASSSIASPAFSISTGLCNYEPPDVGGPGRSGGAGTR
jgi:hypothetical protein